MKLSEFLGLKSAAISRLKKPVSKALAVLAKSRLAQDIGKIAAEAIHSEDSFSQDDWHVFCSEVAASSKDNVQGIMRAIMRASQNIGSKPLPPKAPWMDFGFTFRVPKGLIVPQVNERLMCRIVHSKWLIETIQRKYASGPKMEDFTSRRNEMTKSSHRFIGKKSVYPDVPLGNHLLWATFSADSAKRQPFPLAPQKATLTKTDVGGALGLPEAFVQKQGPLLALGYKLSKANRPTKPSIAHAYAGQPWNCYFRPRPNLEYGETHPWATCKIKGQPELVHELVTLGDCDPDTPFPTLFDD